ncbi:MAG: hypothetical protein P4M09_22805 [Devosia sp.]|nr:hypothetical protein [Devosia sp.]
MRRKDWLAASQRPSFHPLEHGELHRWRVTARLHDGFIKWRGWFDDRADADAFLFAMANGTLKYERALWDLPTPAWRPDIGPDVLYAVDTVVFLTSAGSLLSFTSPADWDNLHNTIEGLGAGGGGAVNTVSGTGGARHSTGAGAGAWGKIVNFAFAAPGTSTASYQIGALGLGGSQVSGNAQANGAAGGDTWFGASAFPSTGAALGVRGGTGGTNNGNAGSITASLGGQAASCYVPGGLAYSGGQGGAVPTTATAYITSGGGGSAGKNGAGIASADSSSSTTAGGNGDNNLGGAGGSTAGTNGSPGTEWDASHGSGGGGGGKNTTGASPAGGDGGNYGAGGGGLVSQSTTGTPRGGNGAPGLLIITYTPVKFAGGFNNPMLGM